MLKKESKWIQIELSKFAVKELNPILSIGSGSIESRTVSQPWISNCVYNPLSSRGIKVVHHELFPDMGIDIAGDLLDSRFQKVLEATNVASILCLNVLEHISDRSVVISTLSKTLRRGGILILTVPRRYPYHPGPIDTLFRPTCDSLAAEFKGFETIVARSLKCESLLIHWLYQPKRFKSLRKVITMGAGVFLEKKPDRSMGKMLSRQNDMSIFEKLRVAFFSTEQTCLILRKL